MKFWEKQISQGSSYLKGWGTDWKETRETLFCTLIWVMVMCEHQAYTLINKLVKSNL